MSAGRFVGAWRLVSLEHVAPDGHATYPLGHHPCGFLTYTAEGYMCAAMAAEGYHGPAENSPDHHAGQEAGSYISFAGRYETTETHVVHHIEICLRRDWVGAPLVRQYAFVGNRLILSTGGLSIVWERAGSTEGPSAQ